MYIFITFDFVILIRNILLSGFLTLPTAYVTGNPVECVVHPSLWNKTNLWDPLGIGLIDSKGQSLDDEYLEENYGAPINTVRDFKFTNRFHKILFSYLFR